MENPKVIGSESTKIIKVFCASSATREKLIRDGEIKIKIGLENKFINVEPCINVKQCFKCNMYGHIETDSSCQAFAELNPRCSNCNSKDHTLEACKSSLEAIKCVNCDKSHNAYDKNKCEKYQQIKNDEIAKEKSKILKTPNEKTLKETWSTIASYQTEIDKLSKNITACSSENKTTFQKVEQALSQASDTNRLLVESIQLLKQDIKQTSEKVVTAYYVKSNNETNEKLDKIQEHIGYLFKSLLPDVQYSKFVFQNLQFTEHASAAPPNNTPMQ
jgi:hypothetical protein